MTQRFFQSSLPPFGTSHIFPAVSCPPTRMRPAASFAYIMTSQDGFGTPVGWGQTAASLYANIIRRDPKQPPSPTYQDLWTFNRTGSSCHDELFSGFSINMINSFHYNTIARPPCMDDCSAGKNLEKYWTGPENMSIKSRMVLGK